MTLRAGEDLHIIACPRGMASHNGAQVMVHGIRWAAQPDLGFPRHGFTILRILGTTEARVGVFFLPRSDSWANFLDDAEARRPALGPYFPTLLQSDLEYLLPVVRLADPRTPPGELAALALEVGDFFGFPHRDDPALAFHHWHHQTPPPLADLLQNPATRDAVIAFYHARATTYLLALSLRFEYAVLFGLGTDDRVDPQLVAPDYGVQARWDADSGRSTTMLDATRNCDPKAPATLTATRVPGTVAHPAFSAWPGWTPPPALSPLDSDGTPLPADSLVPRAPAAMTALSWTDRTPTGRLIDYEPVLYLIGRHDYGRTTAELPDTPPLRPDAEFQPLFDAEPFMRSSSEPHAVDTPGLSWPPLEGHYAYEIRGINLLGTVSSQVTRAFVRHHDDIPPCAPRARSADGPAAVVGADGRVAVEIRIDWDAAEDFVSPDVIEFRVAASFLPLTNVLVNITDVVSANPLTGTIRVASLAGAANRYAGLRLQMPNGEFVIVNHSVGAPATMTVRRSGGRLPAVGATGVIVAAGTPTAVSRVAKRDRTAVIAATVSGVTSLDPLEIDVTPAIAADSGRIYLHLLRSTFAALRVGDRLRISPPAAEEPGAGAWERWRALADPAAAIAASPVLFFVPHRITVSVQAPDGFASGTLSLRITGADAAGYVASPSLPAIDPTLSNLRGNESAAAEVLLSVRSILPPQEPTVGPFDPDLRLWATSAANYAERARFELTWNPAPGAARYEVWRALEGRLSGATPQTSDAGVGALAAAQAAAFELRSGDVYGVSYEDELPGRAPTRAVYKVRALSAAGVPGAFSPVIGPVHVPDVRAPAPPNLLRVVAMPTAVADRALAVEWTHAAPAPDIRFLVEARADAAGARFEEIGAVAAATAPVDGRFRFVHANQLPGRRVAYRVVAVRAALDPVDPTATRTRDIRSLPSATRVGTAISAAPMTPPSGVTAVHDAALGGVRLAWSNPDAYDRIGIYRRAPQRFGFELVAELGGNVTAHDDVGVGPGGWAYQVRARAAGRQARSDIIEVTVP